MKLCLAFNGERKSKNTAVTIKSYRYCRIHFTGVLLFFALSLPLILGIKKGRRFADLKGNLAIYGLFSYAHRSKFCINLKHLCSTRRIDFPCILTPYLTENPSATFFALSGRDRVHWD